MAFDEGLATRLREIFSARPDVGEKKMFGGLAIMYRGNMTVGILGEDLMARVGPERYEEALRRPHAREMDSTHRPMKGFVLVGPEGYAEDDDLARWVGECLAFVDTLPPK